MHWAKTTKISAKLRNGCYAILKASSPVIFCFVDFSERTKTKKEAILEGDVSKKQRRGYGNTMHWMATMKIAMTTRFGCNAITEASSTFVCALVVFSELRKTTLEAGWRST